MVDAGVRRCGAVIVMAGLTFCAVAARAAEVKPAQGAGPAGVLAPPEAASGLTKTLVDPANGGVAGTGLGKMPPLDPSAAGTGMSVKGPPGVGVDLDAAKPAPSPPE